MFKFIYKTITNPIIGPVAVSSIMLMLLAIFYLPTLSLQNQKDKIVQESLSLINDLKTFRSYYSDNVVDKLKNITNISSHLQIAINNPQFKLNQIQKKPFEIV